MNRNPTGIGAIAMSITPHLECQGAPYGITAHVSNAVVNDIAGARMKSGKYAWPGYVSSFMMFFTPSGHRLQQAVRSHPIGPAAILDERADAPLGPDHHHHAHHVDGEDREHLHHGSEEPDELVVRRRQVLERRDGGRLSLRKRENAGGHYHRAPAAAGWRFSAPASH
jgi:hypothetical protein